MHRDGRFRGVARLDEAKQFNGSVVHDVDQGRHYCHIKANCPLLKVETRTFQAAPKGVGLASPMCKAVKEGKDARSSEAGASYLPFSAKP